MKHLLNYNGQLTPPENLIFGIENRAFRYHDSIFETMRIANGRILWCETHAERFCTSLEILNLKLPEHIEPSIEYITKWLQQEVEKTLPNPHENARARLTVFREDGGLYTPNSNNAHFIIQSEPLASSQYQIEEKGMTVGVAESIQLPVFSNQGLAIQTVKNTLSTWYIQANIERKSNNWDEILLKNTENIFIDGGSSAIILVKNGQLLISSKENTTIKSVMQTILIKIATKNGINIKKTSIFAKDLIEADEIICCNVIQGIRFVQKLILNETIYHYSKTNIAQKLNQTLNILI